MGEKENALPLSSSYFKRKTTDKPSMKGLGKQLVSQFSDGKYHRVRDMAEACGANITSVRGICDRIVNQWSVSDLWGAQARGPQRWIVCIPLRERRRQKED